MRIYRDSYHRTSVFLVEVPTCRRPSRAGSTKGSLHTPMRLSFACLCRYSDMDRSKHLSQAGSICFLASLLLMACSDSGTPGASQDNSIPETSVAQSATIVEPDEQSNQTATPMVELQPSASNQEQVEATTATDTSIGSRNGCEFFQSTYPLTSLEHSTGSNISGDVPSADLAIQMNLTIDQFEYPEPSLKLLIRLSNYNDYLANTFGGEFVGSVPLELADNDYLVLYANGERQVLEDKPIYFGSGNVFTEKYDYGSYNATIENIKPGQCVRVAIERQNGHTSLLDTVITIPSLLRLVSPQERDKFTLDDFVTIAWGEVDAQGNTMTGTELERFFTLLHCPNPDSNIGEYKQYGPSFEPIDLASTGSTVFTMKVSDLIYPLDWYRLPETYENSLSGCKLELRFIRKNLPDIDVVYDPLLVNSTASVPSSLNEREYAVQLRRTIELH